MDVLDTARWGLTSMEHWYGLPEAMFEDRTVQDYPLDYNYANEQHRFGQAGRLWRQAAAPGSKKWNDTIDELVKLDFTLDPTLNIYEASRDLMRAYRAEWHDEYTLPSLWRFFAPNRDSHGSYWFDWTTEDEIAWKDNYRLWMTFLNDYKNHGGRVTVGTDSGYIYQTYGFAYVRELELLREAGFHPIEVIRAATLHGAQALGMERQVGSIEPGKLADFVVVGENPLANLKVLYGTGWVRRRHRQPAQARRRRGLHDQRRHRLRRRQAPRRRPRDGRRSQEEGRHRPPAHAGTRVTPRQLRRGDRRSPCSPYPSADRVSRSMISGRWSLASRAVRRREVRASRTRKGPRT